MYTENASALVSEYITAGIRSRKWPEGSRIDTEEAIGASLGVSRVAVRQGIDKLCTLGVLRKQQGSGTYVAPREEASLSGLLCYPCDDELVLQILQFRQIFDSNNVKLFISNARPEEIRALGDFLEQQSADSPLKDTTFHDLIAAGTHNIAIIKVARELSALFEYFHAPKFDDNSDFWHRRIYDAILARDEELAFIYSMRHTQTGIDYITSHIKEAE